mgnify:FL=1
MRRRIYLLYWYEEHGPEDLRAFDSFSALMKADHKEYSDRLLEMDGSEPTGRYPLGDGWGDYVLHIVDVEE